MSLVNAETGELIAECTPDEARKLTDRIHTALGVSWELIVEAYTKRAWAALGHATWDDYHAAEFGKYRLRLPREDRTDVVASLRDAGLSIRAIAVTIGVDPATVHRTLSGVANATPALDRPSVDPETSSSERPDGEQENGSEEPAPSEPSPATITGTDGKTYPSKQANPQTKPRRGSLTDAAERAGWDFRKAVERIERLAADDRFPANREQVAAALRGHLTYAVEVCQDLLDGFDTEPQEAQ